MRSEDRFLTASSLNKMRSRCSWEVISRRQNKSVRKQNENEKQNDDEKGKSATFKLAAIRKDEDIEV